MAQSDNEWDQRILCSDGSCIGIIGSDGHCKACGLPYGGERPLPAAAVNPADTTASAEYQPAAEKDDLVSDDPVIETPASDDSWEHRTLCIDGSCIGVVGPDGRCKACGKPYPG